MSSRSNILKSLVIVTLTAIPASAADPPPAESPPAETTDASLGAQDEHAVRFEELTELHFNPFYYETAFSPGEAETSPTVEMDEIDARHTALVNLSWLDAPFNLATKGLDKLEQGTGLRIRFAYTMVFQQASNGPGDRTAGAGDMDIMAAWTLIGRGTQNTGRLIVTGEYRFKIGEVTPNGLRDQIGSLQRTAGGFNDRGWALRDFHWVQRLFEGKVRILVGRSDVSDYVGAHRLQSINNSFLNRQFSANSTANFPGGHTSSAGLSIRPIDQFYATGGIANAYGSSTNSDWDTLDEGEFFYFGEAGFTPDIKGLGAGRYAVFVWHMDERTLDNLPDDTGFSVILEQDITPNLHLFGRYGWSDDGTTGIKSAGEGGIGYRGLFRSRDNLTGVAFGVSEPTNSDRRDEMNLEVFQRFQLTQFSQFTVGIQGIFDPSNAPDTDAIAVFEARLRVEF